MMEIIDGYRLKINMKNVEDLLVFQFESVPSSAVIPNVGRIPHWGAIGN